MKGHETLARHLSALAALHAQADVAREGLASRAGRLSEQQRQRLADAQRVMREHRGECRAIIRFARWKGVSVPELTPKLLGTVMRRAGLEFEVESGDERAHRRASAGAPRRARD